MKKAILSAVIFSAAGSVFAVDVGVGAGAGAVSFATVNSSNSAVVGSQSSNLIGPGVQAMTLTAGNQSYSNTGASFANTQANSASLTLTNTNSGNGNNMADITFADKHTQGQAITVGNATGSQNSATLIDSQLGLGNLSTSATEAGNASALTGSTGGLIGGGFGVGFN